MLPRLRFVVAFLIIAILPMVLLGSGVFPVPQTSAALAIMHTGKPISVGPDEYSEARYHQDRQALAYARRANELSRLRETASAPLANWVAAPAGNAKTGSKNAETVAKADAEVAATLALAVVSMEKADAPPEELPADLPAMAAPSEAEKSVSPAQKAVASEAVPANAATESSLPAVENAAKDNATNDNTTRENTAAVTDAASTLPQVYVALNGGGQAEALQTAPPPPGFFAPLPKARPKVIRRSNRLKRAAVKPARPAAPAPAVHQQKAPFADLFSWLFGPMPSTSPADATAPVATAAVQTAAR